MEYKNLCGIVKSRLSSERYEHSEAVAQAAVELAHRLGGDVEKCRTAGILHDIAKEMPEEEALIGIKKYNIELDDTEKNAPKLWHAMLGSAICAHELNITDEDIINAIRYHTTGRADMSLTERIIFVSDFISMDRDYKGVDKLRRSVNDNFDNGLYECLKFTIYLIIRQEQCIHLNTIMAYNSYTLKK